MWRTQVHLQDRYAARLDVSGLDALDAAAATPLHWDGPWLRGSVLPAVETDQPAR